jgi:hypothetical protein
VLRDERRKLHDGGWIRLLWNAQLRGRALPVKALEERLCVIPRSTV